MSYRPPTSKAEILEEIAKEINYIKTFYTFDESLLNQLRELWKRARDGEDNVSISRLLVLLNTKQHKTGRRYTSRSVYKGYRHNVLELTYTRV